MTRDDAPERVWLQLYGDSSPDDGPVDYTADGVTWCWHAIFEHDVEYVLKAKCDTLTAEVEALRKLRDDTCAALSDDRGCRFEDMPERALALRKARDSAHEAKARAEQAELESAAECDEFRAQNAALRKELDGLKTRVHQAVKWMCSDVYCVTTADELRCKDCGRDAIAAIGLPEGET